MIELGRDSPRWLTAARMGCHDALGQALQACRCYLLRIARQEVPADLQAKGSASDLVQDAFLDASRAFDRFHGESEVQLRAWLRQLLLRRIAKLGRRYRTTQKRCIQLEQPVDGVDGQGQQEKIPAPSPSPSALVMGEEQTQALRQVLERLPDLYRQVIRLRYEEDRSFEEIGNLLQRSPNAARLLWLRAIERVKKELSASHGP
jgi:RNA polymerase sigma-70 factor (ECF subfamily)